MAYTNFTNCTAEQYKNIMYSQETKNKLKILFNGTELEDADEYCEKFEVQGRVIPIGSKTFMLENLVSVEAELILNNIDTNIIQDQVEISIGTVVGSNSLGDIYEYVPIGIFNIQDKPTSDKGKTKIKLRDNSVKLDFYYNAKPLIDLHGGTATKLQILQDICYQAGITCDVLSFLGDSDEIGIYDNTIKGRQYVSWLAGSAGAIPIITRAGHLDFVYLDNLTTYSIPIEIVEKYSNGDNFKISKVVYENGIIKYEQGTETNDTLFLDSANPYVSSQEQVENIYDIVNGFEINSFETGKVLGNPSIDHYDLIQITDYDDTVYKAFANYRLVYTGKLINNFDSFISLERKKENVTKNSPATFRKWAKTEIDEANARITLQAGQIGDRTHKTTTITEDIDGIESQVANIPPITAENEGIGQIQLQDLAGVKVAGFRVHPTNQDILGLLVSDELIISDDLIIDNREIVFNNGDFETQFDLPALYYYNSDIYDEFVYDTVEERAYKIQRVSVDSQGNKSILSTPIEIDYEYKDIQLEEGDYNIYIATCPSAYIYAKGMVKNENTKTFATTYEEESKRTQLANQIYDVVRKKVDNSEVVASFNLAIEKGQGVVYFKSNQFAVDSDNLKVSKEGDLECNNAKINGNLITANGVLTNLTIQDEIWSWFNENGFDNYGIGFVGFNTSADFQNAVKSFMVFDIKIPDGFIVSNAKIHLKHWPTLWWNPDNTDNRKGSCKNMKIYIMDITNSVVNCAYNSDFGIDLGTYTFNPINDISQFSFSDTEYQEKDIEIPISIFGNNQDFKIAIMTTTSTPSWSRDITTAYRILGPGTGIMIGLLEMIGYMKYNEETASTTLQTPLLGGGLLGGELNQDNEEPLNVGEPMNTNIEEESDI